MIVCDDTIAVQWDFVMSLIMVGAAFFVRFGTLCNIFTAARKDDGGPPPLRSLDHPDGLPSLEGDNWFLAQEGNLFAEQRPAPRSWTLVGISQSRIHPLA